MKERRRSVELAGLLRLVRSRTGLVFGPERDAELVARIEGLMRRRGFSRTADYLLAAGSDPLAFDDLLTELTVGETYFWREPAQLEFIRTAVFPAWRSEARSRASPRVWSAGCASGEEAYSLAILLQESGFGDSATVLGTDLSRARLELARTGEYSKWSLRGVPQEVVHRWFKARKGGRYQIDPSLQKPVRFRELNLAEQAYPGAAAGVREMDLVLCRNVLIYLDRSTVRSVAERLLASLSDEGWLFLGASDPMLNEIVPCEVVVTGSGVAYRRPGTGNREAAERRPRSGLPPGSGPPQRPPPPTMMSAASRPACRPARSADDGALHEAVQARYQQRDYAGVVALVRHGGTGSDATHGLRLLLVRSLANLGAVREALATCESALEHTPDSAELNHLRGTLLTNLGRAAEAIPVLRAALYLDRSLIMGHMALAHAYQLVPDRTAALRELRLAERLLDAREPTATVPASDGLSAARLLDTCRFQIRLLEEAG